MGTTASKNEDEVNFTPQVRQSSNKPNQRKGGKTHEKYTESRNSRSTKRSNSAGDSSRCNDDDNFETQSTASAFVTDESIGVNMRMADLMAYLEVVANNSTNLPLTTRDDPELGRTISNLTGEEYAQKSAAFIPCDVTVIGGSYLRYSRVWDLPSSEKYDPKNRTNEPGISSGGACCNSMLKVLYDSECEESDAFAQEKIDINTDLFADDDDVDVNYDTTKSFDTLQIGGSSLSTGMSLSDMLRKMKKVMKEIEYQQVPSVTSSRKLDLNEPFSFTPANFDPTKNKKRSLLIGCNYFKQEEASLKSCHDDIRSMKDYIINVHGFPEDKDLMTVLLDDNMHQPPTHYNIVQAFKSLSEKSQPGDAVFVQFTGHGGRVLDDTSDSESESYDEIIVPSDYKSSGFIRDTLIFKTLLAPMREGVQMTILLDGNDTGVMLDLPYTWSTINDEEDFITKASLNDNFSFLRFLKVVRSMYEMSTFTRLGNTVNSALDNKGMGDPELMIPEEEEEDYDTSDIGSLITVDENNKATKNKNLPVNQKSGSILTSFQKVLSCGFTANDAEIETDFNRKKNTSPSYNKHVVEDDDDEDDDDDNHTIDSDECSFDTLMTEEVESYRQTHSPRGLCL